MGKPTARLGANHTCLVITAAVDLLPAISVHHQTDLLIRVNVLERSASGYAFVRDDRAITPI
ncbi:hypothetical protein [Nitrincola sp. MINF-07-Sa-05]|uniref:hypothetical protein n=1 Tax=Nitrincola salilacus TaxID=3400273 RepID=UPI0039184E32